MNLNAVIDAAAAAEGVPAPLLRAIGVTESGLNPAVGASRVPPAAGGQRGQGLMQLTPSTAASVGADPNDPAAAVRGAARYLRQGYDATGSWDDATRYYHGGPNRRQWGPRTEAYRTKVSSALDVGGGGMTPDDDVPGAPPIVPDDHDNAFTRGLAGGDASAPPPPGPEADPTNGDNFFSRGLRAATAGAYAGDTPSPVGSGNGLPGPGQGSDRGMDRPSRAGGDPRLRLHGGVEEQSSGLTFGQGLSDFGAGLATGAIATPAATLADGAAWLAGKAGATDLQRRWQGEAQDLMDRGHALANDPTGAAFKAGDFGGEVAATLPLGEVSVLSKLPMIARAAEARRAALAVGEAAPGGARALAAAGRLGDYAVQGGLAGAELSGGSDSPLWQQMATGAAFAPVAGAAIERTMPVLARAGDGARQLAADLRARFPGAPSPAASDDALAQAAALRATGSAGIPAGAPAGTTSVERTANGGSIFLDSKGNSLGGVNADGSPRIVVDINGDAPQQTIRRGSDVTVSSDSQASPGMTALGYVDAYLRGEGRTDPAMAQFAANNGPAIEAEFQRRAQASALRNMTPPDAAPAVGAGTPAAPSPPGRSIEASRQAAGIRDGMSPAEIEAAYSDHAAQAVRDGAAGATPIAPSREAPTIFDARRVAQDFVGKPIANDATGVRLTASSNTLAKMTHLKAIGQSSSVDDHALAVANADHLFRSSEPVSLYPDPRGEPTLNMSRWRAYMDTPNGVRGVKITAKESASPKEPNPLYTVQAMEVEPGFTSPGGSVEGEPARSRYSLPGSEPDVPSPAANGNGAGGGGADAGATAPAESGPPVGIDVSAALGSRGAKAGLEANDDLPPEIAAHVQRLVQEGVPADQALREADIAFVGGKPTLADVTRNPAHQQAVKEGAKLVQTAEGRALNAQVAGNNAAATTAMQRLVADQGGVPAAGEAAQTAAQTIADASDAAAKKTRMLYGMARRMDGDATISIDPLRELLATPEFKAPTQAGSREFVSGIGRLADELSSTNRNRFSADDVEKLRQAANAAYDPMGGQVNGFVGRVKGALDQSMDQFDKAGPGYRAAREAHREWAKAYDDPVGVAHLIRRDAAGNFAHADDWRKAESALVGGISDKAFSQVVRRLQADSGTVALQRLKASILQRAYEEASKGAADAGNNAVVSGQRFFAAFNKVGVPKLGAIFSRDELARIAATGRAAIHINEAVPGTVNTSNTASALNSDIGTRLLSGLETGIPKPSGGGVHVATTMGGAAASMLGHTIGGPLVGAGVSGTKLVADALAKRAARKAMAEGASLAMDPAAARVAARRRTAEVAAALRARVAAQSAARRAAPVAGGEERR